MFKTKPFFFSLCVTATLLFAAPASAWAQNDYDQRYAVIYNYFGVGDNYEDTRLVTPQQFSSHIDELNSGEYHILPLKNIIDAFKNNQKLADKTIAITFDGADKSIITYAAPLLIQHKIPFTVFIPSGRISQTGASLSWDDIKALKRTGIVDFGLQPSSYARLSSMADADIKRQINNSLADIRKETGENPAFFAYPFGEYSKKYKKIVKDMGFLAAFGQQSGVAHNEGDLFAIPRFTLTESFGDMDRFVMTANALPLPVSDITPEDSFLKKSIGFTLKKDFLPFIKALDCFSSSPEKPVIDTINNRVEIRFKSPPVQKVRINCTLPVEQGNGDDTRWRWFGLMLTSHDTQESQDEEQNLSTLYPTPSVE